MLIYSFFGDVFLLFYSQDPRQLLNLVSILSAYQYSLITLEDFSHLCLGLQTKLVMVEQCTHSIFFLLILFIFLAVTQNINHTESVQRSSKSWAFFHMFELVDNIVNS